jgi:hypothetical protein
LLIQLGDEFADSGNTSQKTQRLINYIKDCDVELVMLDEFQHFFDPNKHKDKVLYDVADWFKTIINETKVPFVMFGLDYSSKILTKNEQLEGRFAIHHKLEKFRYETDEDIEDFRRMMYEIDIRLPLVQSSWLADPDISERIYLATDGLMRSMMKLIRRAAKIAIENNHDRIELIDFAYAFDFFYQFKKKKDNPFLTEPFEYDEETIVVAE